MKRLLKNKLMKTYDGLRFKRFFPMVGLVMLVALGCAQNESYTPQPETQVQLPKADGIAPSAKYNTIAIADMDNDGNPDIVGGTSDPGLISISYGDGQGNITAPQYLAAKGDVHSVAVADFNEDGQVDIVYSVQKQSSGIRILMNQSARKWAHKKGPIEINKYQGVAAADVNSDGHMDIIAANASSINQGGVQVWLGNGQGAWSLETGPTVTGMYMDVAAADFNHDGHLDLAGSGWGTYGALNVWLGDGTGNWTSTPPLSHGNFYGISISDINADGQMDILTGSYRTGLQIFVGSGRGTFSAMKNPPKWTTHRVRAESQAGVSGPATGLKDNEWNCWQVVSVDFDGDGLEDILATSLDSEGIWAWRNKNKKGFEAINGPFPSSGTYYEMVVADLNSDGRADISAASYGEGIKVWPGDADAFKVSKLTETEQIDIETYLALSSAPVENNVYKTIDGVAEYKIGPGDLLEITLWEGKEATREEIQISQSGKISFGYVEDLSVQGLTASELDRKLTRRLREYVKKPRIDIFIKEYRSKYVSILGALNNRTNIIGRGSGQYFLSGKVTLLEMITQIGGPTPEADLKSIRIRRDDGQTVKLNLYKTIIQGDASQNFVLNDRDLVYLPNLKKELDRIYVFGEVKEPGAYDFTGSTMRLLDAAADAGGPNAFAYRQDVRIVRGDPTKPEIISANFKDLVELGDQSQNVLLASGDLVYFPRSNWGNIKLFADRIRPLLELVIWPARVINDWDNAADVISGNND